MERFSEFAEERDFGGDKISVNDLLGKTIVVKGFRISDSTKRAGTKCLTISLELDGVSKVCFTGSSVLIDQIQRYESHIPFETVIKQVNKFLTFS